MLAGRINADQAELTAVTTEVLGLFEASLGWGCGWSTPARRLADEWKLTLPEARRLVEVADVLPELPALADAFGAGELPLTVTASIAAVATPATEALLVDQSRQQTAPQMVRTCHAVKRVLRPRAEPEDRPEDFLEFTAHDSGTGVRGFLTPARAELVQKLVEQRRHELRRSSQRSVSNVEAFLSLLEAGPSLPADRFLAILTVDVDAFSHWRHHHLPTVTDPSTTAADPTDPAAPRRLPDRLGVPNGIGVLNGPPLTDDELDAIHGEINAVWMVTRGGHPLWISSSSRTAPPWMRPAIRFAQPECQVQGCGQVGVLEAHHSVPFRHKPETRFDELVHLCPFHHRALHASGASIDFTPDRSAIVLFGADGRPVVFAHRPTPPDRTPSQRLDRAERGPTQLDHGPLTAHAIQTVIDVLAATERRVTRPTPGGAASGGAGVVDTDPIEPAASGRRPGSAGLPTIAADPAASHRGGCDPPRP